MEPRSIFQRAASVSLQNGQLDLWYVLTEKAERADLLDRYRELLTSDEVAKSQRFRIPRQQHESLITRALVRSVLSHYTDEDPRAWVFRENEFGKPQIAEPAGLPLRFNLSHTAGLIVCGVFRDHDVGVDVEDIQRRRVNLRLARRFFAAKEADVVESLPSDKQQVAFFQFWTLKESYIKARGMGLAIPLGSFAFSLNDDSVPAISFADDSDDDPMSWQFARVRLAQRYQVAAAVRLPHDEALTIRLRETVPLHFVDAAETLPSSVNNEWFV